MAKFILLNAETHWIIDAATINDALDQNARDHGFNDHSDAFHQTGLTDLHAYEVVGVELPLPAAAAPPDRHAILSGLIFDMCGMAETYWSNDQIHEMTLMFFDQGGKSCHLDLEVLRHRLGSYRVDQILDAEQVSKA